MLISEQNRFEFLIEPEQKLKLQDNKFYLQMSPNQHSGPMSDNPSLKILKNAVLSQINIDFDIKKLPSFSKKSLTIKNTVVNLLLVLLLDAEGMILDQNITSDIQYIYTIYNTLDQDQKSLIHDKYQNITEHPKLAEQLLFSLKTSSIHFNDQQLSCLENLRALKILCQLNDGSDPGDFIFYPQWLDSAIAHIKDLVEKNTSILDLWPEQIQVISCTLEFLNSNLNACNKFIKQGNDYVQILKSFDLGQDKLDDLIYCDLDKYPEAKKSQKRMINAANKFYKIRDWLLSIDVFRQEYEFQHEFLLEKQKLNQTLSYTEYLSYDDNRYIVLRRVKNNLNYYNELWITENLSIDKNHDDGHEPQLTNTTDVVDTNEINENEIKNKIKDTTIWLNELNRKLSSFQKIVFDCQEHKFKSFDIMQNFLQALDDLDKKICSHLGSTILNWNQFDQSKNLNFYDLIHQGLNIDKINYFRFLLIQIDKFDDDNSLEDYKEIAKKLEFNQINEWIKQFTEYYLFETSYFYEKINLKFENTSIKAGNLCWNIKEYLYCRANMSREVSSKLHYYDDSISNDDNLENLNVFLKNFDMEFHPIDPQKSMILQLIKSSNIEIISDFESLFDEISNYILWQIETKNEYTSTYISDVVIQPKILFLGSVDHTPDLDFSPQQLQSFVQNSGNDEIFSDIMMSELQLFLDADWYSEEDLADTFASKYKELRINQLKKHLDVHLSQNNAFNQTTFLPKDWQILFKYRDKIYEYDRRHVLETSNDHVFPVPLLQHCCLKNNQIQYLLGYCYPKQLLDVKEFINHTPDFLTEDPKIQEHSTTTQLTPSNPCVNNCVTGIQQIREIFL